MKLLWKNIIREVETKLFTHVLLAFCLFVLGFAGHWILTVNHVAKSEPQDIIVLNQKIDSTKAIVVAMKEKLEDYMLESKCGYVSVRQFRNHVYMDSLNRTAFTKILLKAIIKK